MDDTASSDTAADPTRCHGKDHSDGRSSAVPEDPPAVCSACGDAYESVSVHDDGLLVNLHDNERYQRVCFEPAERGGEPVVRFYHHTHDQV